MSRYPIDASQVPHRVNPGAYLALFLQESGFPPLDSDDQKRLEGLVSEFVFKVSPAARLRGVTFDTLDERTATFTEDDWARLEDDNLDGISIDLHDHFEALGFDMDDEPTAVFCRLYLDARDVRLGKKPAPVLAVA
jgi:hypothetical protein